MSGGIHERRFIEASGLSDCVRALLQITEYVAAKLPGDPHGVSDVLDD
jgi:hypothetical protein